MKRPAEEDYGGWTPAAGESPAEREKRLKREKRAAALGAASSGPTPSTSSAPAPSRSATEDYGGWKPAEGESPAEREKRLKREKRAAHLAATAGGSAPAAGPAPTPAARRSEKEEYDGWRPAEGESPAEREKRIKREKRQAMLAARDGGGAEIAPYEQQQQQQQQQQRYGGYDAPPHAAPAAAGAAEDTAAAAAAEAKKSKNAQSMTTARKRYLKRKKQTRKAKKAAMPKRKNADADGVAAAGTKRPREDDDEDEDEESGSEDGSESGDEDDAPATAASTTSKPSVGADKWPDLTEAERAAKLADIAAKKAARREARLAKKAELKRIKAEGGVAPPPKRRVVETTKPRARETTVVEPEPVEEKEEEKEPTEEELEEQKKREEIAARKALKALKKAQRRNPEAAPVAPAAEDTDMAAADGEPSTLIPTAPSPPADRDAAADAPAAYAGGENAATTPASPPAALLRLPGATRPAPPSAKVLSALNVHEQVRDKQVVDPLRKILISEEIGVDGTGVGEKGRKRLRNDMGIEEWFAVQTAVLPLLLPPSSSPPALYSPFNPPRDVCVSAPTGSGKTLSYVVPIVETLQRRIVTRLRALVLLPTRDLVGQVRETFESYARGTGLKIGVATGQHSFAHEQSVLVGDDVPADLQGGSSQVDILIATPGRLIDHLKATKGFSLQHLRFLVVDEADRLLTQSFHDWLPTVLSALKPSFSAAALVENDVNVPLRSSRRENKAPSKGDKLPTADALAPAWWDAEGKVGRIPSDVDERCQGSCQKLLFSATLSRDPAKIDALHLHRPVYISVEDALDPHAEDEGVDNELKFTFPAELSEHMIISPASHKPLYLFHLLHTLSISSALCFTKSVEAATRLAKLVEFFEEARLEAAGATSDEKKKVVVKPYSSELTPAERKAVLRDFKKGEVQMLICSDLIARGIDIPNVSHVISYDIPADMRKYVHRVGRTARAGNKGDAWSLVEEQEVAPFKAIMSSAQHYGKIDRVRVKDPLIEPFVPAYQVALERLRLFFATGRERERSTVAA